MATDHMNAPQVPLGPHSRSKSKWSLNGLFASEKPLGLQALNIKDVVVSTEFMKSSQNWGFMLRGCVENNSLPFIEIVETKKCKNLNMGNGDVILSINKTSVVGRTRKEVLELFKSSPQGVAFVQIVPHMKDKSLSAFLSLFPDRQAKAPVLENIHRFTVPCTTRVPDADEIDGVHYNFISRSTFKQLIESKRLLEYETIGDEFYGTLRFQGSVDENFQLKLNEKLASMGFDVSDVYQDTNTPSMQDSPESQGSDHMKTNEMNEFNDSQELEFDTGSLTLSFNHQSSNFPQGEWATPSRNRSASGSYSHNNPYLDTNSMDSASRGMPFGGPRPMTSNSFESHNAAFPLDGVTTTDTSTDDFAYSVIAQQSEEELGPLPSGWTMLFTHAGEKFFANHETQTTQWLDPRLQRIKLENLDLPVGWDVVHDPAVGTYYVDHLNKRTTFEHPTLYHMRPVQASPPRSGREQKLADLAHRYTQEATSCATKNTPQAVRSQSTPKFSAVFGSSTPSRSNSMIMPKRSASDLQTPSLNKQQKEQVLLPAQILKEPVSARRTQGKRGSHSSVLEVERTPARNGDVKSIFKLVVKFGDTQEFGFGVASGSHGRLMVSSVDPQSPVAGLLVPSDIILAINGESVVSKSPHDFYVLLYSMVENSDVLFTVERDEVIHLDIKDPVMYRSSRKGSKTSEISFNNYLDSPTTSFLQQQRHSDSLLDSDHVFSAPSKGHFSREGSQPSYGDHDWMEPSQLDITIHKDEDDQILTPKPMNPPAKEESVADILLNAIKKFDGNPAKMGDITNSPARKDLVASKKQQALNISVVPSKLDGQENAAAPEQMRGRVNVDALLANPLNQLIVLNKFMDQSYGFKFSLNKETQQYEVDALSANSIAQKDGRMQPGDILLAVNSTMISNMEYGDVISLIKSDPSNVFLVVQKSQKNLTIEFNNAKGQLASLKSTVQERLELVRERHDELQVLLTLLQNKVAAEAAPSRTKQSAQQEVEKTEFQLAVLNDESEILLEYADKIATVSASMTLANFSEVTAEWQSLNRRVLRSLMHAKSHRLQVHSNFLRMWKASSQGSTGPKVVLQVDLSALDERGIEHPSAEQVGVVLTRITDAEDEQIPMVVEVNPASPAGRAGFFPGDLIVDVAGFDSSGWSNRELFTRMISNIVQGIVCVTVQRAAAEAPFGVADGVKHGENSCDQGLLASLELWLSMARTQCVERRLNALYETINAQLEAKATPTFSQWYKFNVDEAYVLALVDGTLDEASLVEQTAL